MRLRVTSIEIGAATLGLLDAWMDASGWFRGSEVRRAYRAAATRASNWPVVALAVRGFDLVGIAAFIPGVEGTPIVIVHPEHRQRGIGSRLLRALGRKGLPLAWACSRGGARLCRRVGVRFKRVHG